MLDWIADNGSRIALAGILAVICAWVIQITTVTIYGGRRKDNDRIIK